tara:strand:- start:623 stop:853 length:231 start_codon:yes stop_codon:yes gene_type:complete
MNLHRKTYKSRKKWEFMGFYGNPCSIPLKKFKILLKITQYIVSKIKYIHTYGYLFGKSVDQKIMNFLPKNNNLSKI